MTNSRIFAIAALALGLPAAALASGGGIDEATQQKVRDQLGQQGYEVRKIDREDGLIEVYALKDGQRFEIYLDDQLEIVRTKSED